MRIAIFGVLHETNTFVPGNTTFGDFSEGSPYGRVLRGEDVFRLRGTNSGVGGFMSVLDSIESVEIVPLLWCEAEPGATVAAATFDQLCEEIIDALIQRGPVDAICADLHGAMVAENARDAELAIVRRLREVVGPDVPVVASLDLHGNISPELVSETQGLSAYRTYPHVDTAQAGERAARQLVEQLERGVSPASAFRALPFFVPMHQQGTVDGPGGEIYEQLERIEAGYGGRVHLSFLFGFYAADFYWSGPSVLAYGRKQAECDEAIARLFAEVIRRRGDFCAPLCGIEDAVAQARAHSGPGPLLLAEVQDNAGGGSSSAGMELTGALIEGNVAGVAVSALFNPGAVQQAEAIGVGRRGRVHFAAMADCQAPYENEFLVEYLGEGAFTVTGPMATGMDVDLGRVAVLVCGGVRIVVSSVRVQNLDLGCFTVAGIAPEQCRVLVVKSTLHYRGAYDPIAADRLSVETPGYMVANPGVLSYAHLRTGVHRLP